MTLPVLPATASLSYNGVTFSALNKSRISGKPVQGPDGRALKEVEYNVEVTGYVTPSGADTDTNNAMADLRKRLTQPAGALSYDQKGFGTFKINQLGVYDTSYGPWPELLDFTPIGNDRAAHVTWRCTTRIPEAAPGTGAPKYNSVPMAFSWTADFTVDDGGYTTIRYSGELTVPANRIKAGDAHLGDSADNYLLKITPPIKVGFKRQSFQRRLSADKRTASFTITDQEIPRPLPNGMSSCDVNHTVGSKLASPWGFRSWYGSISGTLTLAKDKLKADALATIHLLIFKRLGVVRGDLSAIKPGKGKTVTIIDTFEITEAIYGRTVSFNCAYRVLNCGLNNILTRVGMFEKPPGTFAAWHKSLANSGLHPRGYRKLGVSVKDDRIVELSGNTDPLMQVSVFMGEEPKAQADEDDQRDKTITRESSWLNWHCALSVAEDTRAVIHKPLGPLVFQGNKGADVLTGYEVVNQAPERNATKPDRGTNQTDVIQQLQPGWQITLRGQALRLKYKIPCPQLLKVPGGDAVLKMKFFDEDQPTCLGDIPVHRAKWGMVYIIKKSPTGPIEVPSNPMMEKSAD